MLEEFIDLCVCMSACLSLHL